MFSGYGHVTPQTTWGMLSTILYCVFGLPLTLMCIANLGKFFARVFRILYHTVFCGICCICCLSCRKKKLAKKLAKEEAIQSGGVSNLDSVGNGTPIVISNDPTSEKRPQGARAKFNAKSQIAITKAQVWVLNVKKKFSHSLRDDVTVPVYLCLVVMAAYIMGGALLFSLWDGWGYLEGAYFCFVTLTTIGFGDYVPGISAKEEGATERLILCSIYVFLGLALVGMCIDLMQADVVQKLRWIAQKIGVMSSDNKKVPAEDRTDKRATQKERHHSASGGLKVDVTEISSGDDDSDSDDDIKFVSPVAVDTKGETTLQYQDEEDEKTEPKKKASKKLSKKGLKAKKKSKESLQNNTEANQSPVHKPLLDNLREDMENPAGNSAGAGDGQIERLDAEGEDDTNKNNNASSTVLNALRDESNEGKKASKSKDKEKKKHKDDGAKAEKDKKLKKAKEKKIEKSKAKRDKPTNAGETSTIALVHPPAVDLTPPDDEHGVICDPPPPYAELSPRKDIEKTTTSPATSSSVTTPASPASHYDDLPSHISSLTPDHTRLQDVETPHRPIPPDGSSLKSYADLNHNGIAEGDLSPSSEELLDNVLDNPLFTNSKSSKFSMQFDDEDENDELLLTVSRASNV